MECSEMFSCLQNSRREVRDEDIKLVNKAFHLADENKKGFLNRQDLKVALIATLGYKPSKYELDSIIDKYGKRQSELESRCEDFENTDELVLDFATFKVILLERMKFWDLDEEVRETFQMLDARCKGFIDYDDYEKVVRRFLPKQDCVNIKRMFSEADRDGDGRVSFRDFQFLMQPKS